jgi:hypothetical protein
MFSWLPKRERKNLAVEEQEEESQRPSVPKTSEKIQTTTSMTWSTLEKYIMENSEISKDPLKKSAFDFGDQQDVIDVIQNIHDELDSITTLYMDPLKELKIKCDVLLSELEKKD